MQFPIRDLTKALIPPLDATPLVQVLGLLCYDPPLLRAVFLTAEFSRTKHYRKFTLF